MRHCSRTPAVAAGPLRGPSRSLPYVPTRRQWMITGDHDLHQTRWTSPTPRMYAHFKLWPFYKAFSTLNARGPLFAGTIRNLSLAPSKMLRHLPRCATQRTARPWTNVVVTPGIGIALDRLLGISVAQFGSSAAGTRIEIPAACFSSTKPFP
jgi:hypothetical protein